MEMKIKLFFQNIKRRIYVFNVKRRLYNSKIKWFKEISEDLTNPKKPFEVKNIISLIQTLSLSSHRRDEIDSKNRAFRLEYNASVCISSDDRALYCLTAKLIESPNMNISSVSDITINLKPFLDEDNVVIDFSMYNPVMSSAMRTIKFDISQQYFQFNGDIICQDTYHGAMTNRRREEIRVLMEVLSNIFTVILDNGKEWMTKP